MLLKYDLNKEDFHFVNDKRKKNQKPAKEEQDECDIKFEDGKMIFTEVKKRRREETNDEDE